MLEALDAVTDEELLAELEKVDPITFDGSVAVEQSSPSSPDVNSGLCLSLSLESLLLF